MTIRSLAGHLKRRILLPPQTPIICKSAEELSAEHWTDTNVTNHRRYSSVEESLAYFRWRNDLYVDYLELMPVAGFDNNVVVDFGCGPGHDLIGFGAYSKPKTLIGIDVSSSSLAEAKDRLEMHGIAADLILQRPEQTEIPLPDASVDHIHSSGVLHHTVDPVAILKELRRVLKPNGTMNIMVYNYDSVFVHLWIAYGRMILENQFPGEDIKSVFRRSTDGPGCPISNVYKPQEWIDLCAKAGVGMEFSGASISTWEMDYLQQYRFKAGQHETLPEESRKFLLDLTFDKRGYAMYGDHLAGVDGCFRLKQNP